MSEPKTCGECKQWMGTHGPGVCTAPIPQWVIIDNPDAVDWIFEDEDIDNCPCFAPKEDKKDD